MNKLNQSVLLILLMLFTGFAAEAQSKISIKSFVEDPNETTARVHSVIDESNGEKCALIIITNIGAGGYKFDVGGFSKLENGETRDGSQAYFLYVAPGTRSVSISNPGSSLLPLRNYTFKTGPLKKATTYFMELGNVYTSTKKQYLEFTVSPADAYLEVNGVPWKLDENGYANKTVTFGTYNYVAKADMYHTEVGVETVDDESKAKKVVLNLRPAFGYLTIDGSAELDGANIVVDDKFIGTGNVNRTRLANGRHILKISKDMYATYIDTVYISENKESRIRPTLESTAADVRISGKGMDIYLDGRKLARDEWNGRLEPGDYVFEGRMDGYRPSKKQLTVHHKGEKIERQLPTPEAIYGAIKVETDPAGAQITIDGVVKGNTPQYINNILIGRHEVVIDKEGYQPVARTIEVKEGDAVEISEKMSNILTLRIIAPESETVQVDGENRKLSENGTVSVPISPGEHTIVAEPRDLFGSKSYYKTGRFNRNTELVVRHQFRMSQRSGAYLMVGGAFGSMTNVSATVGYHLAAFCVEGEYQYAGFNDKVILNTYAEDSSGAWYKDGMTVIDCSNILSFRAGWRFVLGSNFAITPLVGYRLLIGSKSSDDYGPSVDGGDYANSITVAARFVYKWNRHFGIALTPEYYQKAGAAYKWNLGSSISNKVKSYMTGFNVNLSVLLNF